MSTRNRIVIAVAALVVAVGGAAAFYWFSAPPPQLPKKTVRKPAKRPKKTPLTCPLDGLPAAKELIDRKPLAVMIENLIDIRPQTGLSKACLVIEGLSEAGITRFMAVYGSHGADRLGPVRSARTHFVALARGMEALYAHAGGSVYALQAIQYWGVDDLDQFTYPQAYQRVPGIKAPHNLFTSTAALRSVKDDSGRSGQKFLFKNDVPAKDRPEGQTVNVGFKERGYDVSWRYQRGSNSYLRFNAGSPHLDAMTNTQLKAKNIVVMFARTSPILGGGLVLDVTVTGTGRLLLYRDGTVIEGTWEKADVYSPLTLLGPDGGELKLNPGQTWIEIVPPDVTVTGGANP